jgi:hypothetical protein
MEAKMLYEAVAVLALAVVVQVLLVGTVADFLTAFLDRDPIESSKVARGPERTLA